MRFVTFVRLSLLVCVLHESNSLWRLIWVLVFLEVLLGLAKTEETDQSLDITWSNWFFHNREQYTYTKCLQFFFLSKKIWKNFHFFYCQLAYSFMRNIMNGIVKLQINLSSMINVHVIWYISGNFSNFISSSLIVQLKKKYCYQHDFFISC